MVPSCLSFVGGSAIRPRSRASRPRCEGLEARILLYADLGDQWSYGSRITYSFMPDGTSVGGVPSALFQTMNANNTTAAWEQQIEQAASLWESATNINLALVSDGGQPVGVAGNQQDDPRFGDIRVGAVPLSSGVLAETFLPPPDNGGTDAGDILFNSNINWNINSTYDIQTVAAHEFGHALGLGESLVSSAVMYGTYGGIKQALTSDDISGIQSIYGTRQFDQFNTGGHRNNSSFTATNINSYINGNAQISIPSLDITTSGDTEWYFVNVPSSSTGTMSVSVQSSNLSSLSPNLQVYSSSLSLIGQMSAPGSLGATVNVSTSVSAGQGYYIKVTAAGGPGPIGGYGLLVNFGSHTQAPIPPPNTVVPGQPNGGGGIISNAVNAGANAGASVLSTLPSSTIVTATIGTLSGLVELMTIPDVTISGAAPGGSSGSQTHSASPPSTGVEPGGKGSPPIPPGKALLTGPVMAGSVGPSAPAALQIGPLASSSLIPQAIDAVLSQWKTK